MRSALVAVVSSVASATYYCPSQNDFDIAYLDKRYPKPSISNQGWHITGGGGVASLASFNLLGGYVEFDVDLGNVQSGVNANVYAISPSNFKHGHFHKKSDYCDGAGKGSNFCLEVDWLEANGHCGAAMTIHAIEGKGTGCTAWGCRASYNLKSTTYHMRVDYDMNGKVKVQRNGHVVEELYPEPPSSVWDTVRQSNQQHGSVIYSSEWVGWVPQEGCGTNGDLSSSSLNVSNLVVSGTVVQGPVPTLCGSVPLPRRRRSTPPRRRAAPSRRRRSRVNCADDTHDCRSARCCKDSGKTCYEKDANWASCRDNGSCHPGLNPNDPKGHRTPWSCNPITGSTPPRRRRAPSRRRRSRANCADDTHDCRSARCCKDSGKTCYEKDANWASCRDSGSCHPGLNPYDPPAHRTPWSCNPITGLNAEGNTSHFELV